ncbi:sulfurtransferase [Dyella soli]|uniref:tRNA uridine(34) hydroxylase n=1 Tax=Dyella soli TaxID=522319 RepID=A0A4R0YE94_9GAMM|nr:sulfurtransferase [Dyella soli]TCI06347.1 sulfurtransferase [Dyella soli]
MSIINLSAYRFVSLDDLPALRERVLERCLALDLKGTILLAPEGINLFLAGPSEPIEAFMDWLRLDPRFVGLEPKVSVSASVPFGRMRVRLKKEIITMRMPAIRPEGARAPAVAPRTLQRWLAQGHDDQGREVVLLDTRNDYETDVGLFHDAVDYRLGSFTEFPDAIAADRARFENKTVVSYCTGGIRCEKAALHMQDLGIDNVFQLEGGILKYFEETDGAHWRGDCFVFDERGAVDKSLAPASLLPLPGGARGERPWMASALKSEERVGVRGGSSADLSSARASFNAPASTHPSSAPSGHLLPGGEKDL